MLTLSSSLGRGGGQRIPTSPPLAAALDGWARRGTGGLGLTQHARPCSPRFPKARSPPWHKHLLGIFLTHQNHFHVHPGTSLHCPCASCESNEHSRPDSSPSSHVKPPGILSPDLGVSSILEPAPKWLPQLHLVTLETQESHGSGQGEWAREGRQRAGRLAWWALVGKGGLTVTERSRPGHPYVLGSPAWAAATPTSQTAELRLCRDEPPP